MFEQVAQGAPTTAANAWPVEVTDGTNVLGTPTHPIKVDPTGTTTQPVSGTVATTSASMAAPGSAVPSDATYVAAKNPSGDLTGLNVDTAGSLIVTTEDNTFELTGLNVDGSGNLMVDVADPVTVIQTTPANLKATVLNQDGSGNALTSTSGALDSNLKTIGGSALSIGQKLSAASIPVVIASDQNLTVTVGAVYNNQTGTVSSGAVPTTTGGTLTILTGVFTWSTLVLNLVAGTPLSMGGAFQVEGSIDNVNWTPLTGTLLSAHPQQVTQYLTTTFPPVSYIPTPLTSRYNLAGFPYIRIHTTAGFTGTINVEYALTTALGDETSFSKTELIDASGAAVNLPNPTQYLAGATPTGALYQSGGETFAALPEGWMSNTYVLPKSPIIGDTLIVALVAFGTQGGSTALTAAHLASLKLTDSNNISYSPSTIYDTTFTHFGEAIILFSVPVTQLDSENNLGFSASCSGLWPVNLGLFIHELQNVSIPVSSGVGVLSVGSSSGSSGSSITPPSPGAAGFPMTLIITQTSAFAPTVPAWAEIVPNIDAEFWGISGSSLNPITYATGTTNEGYDIVTIAVPVVSTGTLAMGLDYTNNEMHPLSVTSTGALNSTLAFPSSLPVTQSGSWTVGVVDGTVGNVGAMAPSVAALLGTKNPSGDLEPLQVDASGNLLVSFAGGSGCWASLVKQSLSTIPVWVKAGAGQLGGYAITNSNTAMAYVFFYNSAYPTVGSATDLLYQIGVPAGGAVNVEFSLGITFGTYLTIAASASVSSAVAPTTGVTVTTVYK